MNGRVLENFEFWWNALQCGENLDFDVITSHLLIFFLHYNGATLATQQELQW